MASIETLLDKQGKGVLTAELFSLFVSNGCHPECHICDRKLKEGDRIHLKPFFMKTTPDEMLTGGAAQAVAGFDLDYDAEILQVDNESKTTNSIDVMICEACSDTNKRLPEGEANKLLALAYVSGMVEPAPERLSDMGLTGPQTYSNYRSSGRGMREGGCMIVRQSGQAPKIIGSESGQRTQ